MIAAAKPHFTRLHLRTRNPAADALYRSLAFVPSDQDAMATHIMHLSHHR